MTATHTPQSQASAHPKQPAMMPQMTQMDASQRGPPMRVSSMLAGIWQHA